MEKNVTIIGANNLQASILSTDLIEDKGTVTMSLVANLPNPSIVSILDLGDLTFNISYKGSHITTAVAEDVQLVEGNTTLEIRAPMLPENINNNPAALEMLGNYISNLTTDMDAVMIHDSVPLYSSFLEGYSMGTSLQPLANPILRVTIMDMTPENVGMLYVLNSTLVATRFGMYNPLSIPLRITNINTDVTFNNNGTIVYLGNVTNNTYVNGSALDIIVPPKNFHLSAPLYVHVHNISLDVITAMSADMGPAQGYICLGAHGDVESHLGNLDTTTRYLQGESILTCNLAGSPDICMSYLNLSKPSPCA
jgi:LEA14-like dessication related protein